jgi:hypothetical protein
MNKLFSFLAIPFIATFVIMPVSAQTSLRTNEGSEIQQTQIPRSPSLSEADKLKLKEEREEKIRELQCEAAKTRAESHKQIYEAQQLRYGNRYVSMLTRLNSLSERLEENNYDTLNLPEYVDQLTDMVEVFNTDLKVLISKLEEMRPVTCTTSGEEYVKILREAKAESTQLRTRSREINQYFLNTILPELKRVRAQVRAESETEPNVSIEPSETTNLTN